ncbi:MAG TPA: lysophospholipid acyltransferase family protein [Bryobacteraceae bacterium]
MAQKKSWLQIRAEYVLASALVYGLRALPLAAANRLGYAAAGMLDLVLPKLRRVALTNLSFAFPGLDSRSRKNIVDGTFRSVGRLLVAISRFQKINASNVHDWISYEGLENYRAAKQEGRGVLIATAHLGNWELSAFAHALMTEPMNVMVRPLDNPLIDRLVENARALAGNRLIYKKDAARSVLKALKNNEAVGVLIDQNTSPSEGLFVNFFGRQACAGSGFVKLAYHSRAPVIPGFALWDEKTRRYILRFFPRVELSGDELADTQRIHSRLEDVIREYPQQWMWIHRRWKTRPNGEKPIY